jgi:hypothetical protein
VSNRTEYSASVEIWLELAGECVSVAQVSEHSLILRQPADLLPDQRARVILTVDGEDKIYPILIRVANGRTVEFDLCESLPDGAARARK